MTPRGSGANGCEDGGKENEAAVLGKKLKENPMIFVILGEITIRNNSNI